MEFIRSPNHFALLAPDNTKLYKLTLQDMVLLVMQFLAPEAIESNLQKKLNDSSFHLPITRLVPHTRGLQAGIHEGSVTHAITGKCPFHLMIYILSNKQVNGDLSVDSYFFNPQFCSCFFSYLICA